MRWWDGEEDLLAAFVCFFVCLVGFSTSSSTTRLYRGRAQRQSVWQFYVLPHMRQSWETMTSVSAGHIILTPTQPVGSGRPQRGSNPRPPHQESRALPTEQQQEDGRVWPSVESIKQRQNKTGETRLTQVQNISKSCEKGSKFTLKSIGVLFIINQIHNWSLFSLNLSSVYFQKRSVNFRLLKLV